MTAEAAAIFHACERESVTRRRAPMRIVLKVFLCGMTLSAPATRCGAGEGPAILVLDATAQMSAKLGQQRKIDAVKSAVSATVNRMSPDAQLAVWAFGTNPAKKCEDKGELVRLQAAAGAAGAADKALAPIQPRAARAPVFGTLQSALESAGGAKDAALSAVLIAGTGDDCTGDICGEAKKLHSAFPNTKLTVLGIGMSEQAAANFECAAKSMGGGFTAVKSGTDLERTLRQALDIAPNAKIVKAPVPAPAAAPAPAPAAPSSGAAEKAEAAAGTAPATAPAAPADAKPAVPPQPQAEPNTVLSAALGSGTPPLDSGVTWEVYKIHTTPTGQLRPAETPLWTGGGGQAKVKLAEGNYKVRASYGLASGEDGLSAGADKVEKNIVLNAGTIAAEAFQAREAQPAEGVFFILSRRKGGSAFEELGRSSQSPAIFHVNAGDYVLSASSGLSKLDAAVKVEAGKVSAVRMALNVGTLEIKTFAAGDASKPVPAWHRIFPAAAEAGEGGAPLLRIAGGAHRLQLPAGNYRLETEYGNARVESTVTVAAAQTVSQNVVVQAGEAAISFPSAKVSEVCSAYETGANRQAGASARAAGNSITFILKPGVYDIECRAAGAQAPLQQAQIRVAAGETVYAKIGE
jgi:hypothetical protein